MEFLKQGTKIRTNNQIPGKITGEITGIINSNSAPDYATSYMIRIETKFGRDWEIFEYSCIALTRACFEVIEE
jgi:hypothetical protein